MAEESAFVGLALAAARRALKPPLSIERGAALLYEVTLDNALKPAVDPRAPTRGDWAFQTDLCVFEAKPSGVALPRVVFEFKTRLTTHDVLTYSAKARRHKQVYRWLRYGFVVSDAPAIPHRFFTHNEGIDFFLAAGGADEAGFAATLAGLLADEVETSRRLERLAFGGARPTLYRTEVRLTPADEAAGP